MAEPVKGWLRRHWLPWLPLVLGPSLLFVPALLAGRGLFWGTPLLQFTPWHSYAKQLLAAGQLPLWNPALGMGAPLLANYQSALLYPPNWSLLLLNVAWGQTLLVLLHLIWAGIGMALLARWLGLGRVAQTVAGLAYALSGYLITRAGFLSINAASAWLPWIVLAADRLLAACLTRTEPEAGGQAGRAMVAGQPGERLRAAGILAAALAMQWLSGHAQVAWYSLVLLAAWVAFRALSRRGWSGLTRVLLPLGLAGSVAFLISAAQLLPTLEYLNVSDRSTSLDPEFAMTYSFWPWRAAGLLAPDLYGHPRDGNYWGYGNYWEDAVYIGVLPLLLAAAALLRRRGRRIRWFLAAICGLSLLLALGDNTPVFPFLFEHVPTFSLFQAPTRWTLLLIFGLSLLAGLGAEGWGVAQGRALYWLRLGTAGAAAVVLTALLGNRLLTGIQPTFAPAILQAGVLLLASGALALTRHRQPSPSLQALAVALVLADLVYAGRGANPTLPLAAFEARPPGETEPYRNGRLFMSSELETDLKYDQAFRFDSFQPEYDWSLVRQEFLPNTGLLDGVVSANNFDPILPARYVGWMGGLSSLPAGDQLVLLRHMDVTWFAQGTAEYQPLPNSQRAWMASQATWIADQSQALKGALADPQRIDQQVVLEGKQPAEPLGAPADGADAVISITDRDPGTVDLQVQATGAGWLVLADAWYPGWNAYLDGQPAESYAADSVFRATWVPGGSHHVVYRYQPVSVKLGLGLSGLGLLGLGIALRSGTAEPQLNDRHEQGQVG